MDARRAGVQDAKAPFVHGDNQEGDYGDLRIAPVVREIIHGFDIARRSAQARRAVAKRFMLLTTPRAAVWSSLKNTKAAAFVTSR
jgi:hypothetical protein